MSFKKNGFVFANHLKTGCKLMCWDCSKNMRNFPQNVEYASLKKHTSIEIEILTRPISTSNAMCTHHDLAGSQLLHSANGILPLANVVVNVGM